MKQNVRAVILSLRPKQWIKNCFVFAALIFVRAFTDSEKIISALFAFILFCGVASAVYILNDIVDRKRDKEHPVKRNRPLAAGQISPTLLGAVGVLLAVGSLFGAYQLNLPFFYTISAYAVLNIFYSFVLKNLIILDVVSIALGFVLRVIAGAVAIGVAFSPWLIFCTFFLTLFLGVSKRKSELILSSSGSGRSGILADYSKSFLDQISAIVLPLTLTTYTFYTFSSEHNRLLMLTVPIVLYGLLRYLYIVEKKRSENDGPTDDLWADRPLQITIIIWIVFSAAIIWYRG